MEFFTGSVTVRLLGKLSAAKLTQIAQHIPLKNVRRTKDGVVLELPLGDVRALRTLLRGQGMRMRVLKRRGLPFLRVQLRRSAPFWVAATAALLVLVYLSSTVLEVRISGVQNAARLSSLQQQLQELGVQRGAALGSIDKRQVEEAVQQAHPELTYVSLRRRGTSLELFVVEATDPPEIFDRNQPVDVVAGSAGLIVGVTVFSGTALVQPGDTVRQGQVLIQGVDHNGNPCHASGQVTARLWHRGAGQADLYQEQRQATGRQFTETRLSVLGFELPWFQKENGFACYDVSHQKGRLLDGLFFPIEWDKITVYEVVSSQVRREYDEVARQAAQRALTDALNLIPNGARVVDKRLEYSKIGNEKLLATLTLETLAEIGVQVEGAGVAREE